jgi:hypothetical protein
MLQKQQLDRDTDRDYGVDIELLKEELHNFKTTTNERLGVHDAKIESMSFKFDDIKLKMEQGFDNYSHKFKSLEDSSKHNYKVIIVSFLLIFLFLLVFIYF